MTVKQVPLVDYLHIGARPYLKAKACTSCGARFFDRRIACGNCGAQEFENARVRNQGVVTSFTIVHRAAPGHPGAVRVGDHRDRRRHERAIQRRQL